MSFLLVDTDSCDFLTQSLTQSTQSAARHTTSVSEFITTYIVVSKNLNWKLDNEIMEFIQCIETFDIHLFDIHTLSHIDIVILLFGISIIDTCISNQSTPNYHQQNSKSRNRNNNNDNTLIHPCFSNIILSGISIYILCCEVL